MSFDEIAVIAIHRANEIRQGIEQADDIQLFTMTDKVAINLAKYPAKKAAEKGPVLLPDRGEATAGMEPLRIGETSRFRGPLGGQATAKPGGFLHEIDREGRFVLVDNQGLLWLHIWLDCWRDGWRDLTDLLSFHSTSF